MVLDGLKDLGFSYHDIWGLSKLGSLFWGGTYNKDPSILGAILGSPIFGNSHMTRYW